MRRTARISPGRASGRRRPRGSSAHSSCSAGRSAPGAVFGRARPDRSRPGAPSIAAARRPSGRPRRSAGSGARDVRAGAAGGLSRRRRGSAAARRERVLHGPRRRGRRASKGPLTVGARRRVLKCPAMNATTPDRETAPPRRVSLVLHPGATSATPSSWSPRGRGERGPSSRAVEDGRLPEGVAALPDRRARGRLRHRARARRRRDDARRPAPGRAARRPVLGRQPRPPGLPHRGRRRASRRGARGARRRGLRRRGALRAERRGRRTERRREQVAFNDVVLSRVPGRGQALLALRVDGQLLVRYASDGVIAATPAGSTAYSSRPAARSSRRRRAP